MIKQEDRMNFLRSTLITSTIPPRLEVGRSSDSIVVARLIEPLRLHNNSCPRSSEMITPLSDLHTQPNSAESLAGFIDTEGRVVVSPSFEAAAYVSGRQNSASSMPLGILVSSTRPPESVHSSMTNCRISSPISAGMGGEGRGRRRHLPSPQHWIDPLHSSS